MFVNWFTLRDWVIRTFAKIPCLVIVNVHELVDIERLWVIRTFTRVPCLVIVNVCKLVYIERLGYTNIHEGIPYRVHL